MYQIEELHNIPYDKTNHPKHHLDIYKPKNTSEKHPVVFFVHGGGWKRGDRKWRSNLYKNVGETLAKNGFVCVVISYRLSNLTFISRLIFGGLVGLLWCFIIGILSVAIFGLRVTQWPLVSIWILLYIVIFGMVSFYASNEGDEKIKHPDHVTDVANAFNWVRNNIHSFSGDPNKIFLAGHSAGAHLATLFECDDSYTKKIEGSKDGVLGVIGLSGVYNFVRLNTKLFAKYFYVRPIFHDFEEKTLLGASPISFCSGRKHPPYLLLNARYDFHLTEDADELKSLLLESNTEVESKIISGTHHMSIVSRIGSKSDTTTPVMIEWMNKQLDKLKTK